MTEITPKILLQAYAAGLFPMAESADDPTLHWVDPEERGIIPLDAFHVPRSLRKTVIGGEFAIRVDTAFLRVITSCAEATNDRRTTWINDRILNLYTDLHKRGSCHSVESWFEGELVGGLYGVRIGAAFFGESMFSRRTNASKVALVHLVARLNAGGFKLLDAQFMNNHLVQFGSHSLSRAKYKKQLRTALTASADFTTFKGDDDGTLVAKTAMRK
jgi:leucyl/phenylalanyl-tRNA---protein transferase